MKSIQLMNTIILYKSVFVALEWAHTRGLNTGSTMAVQTDAGLDPLAHPSAGRWKCPVTLRECESLSGAGRLSDTPRWGFFTSNTVWRWSEPGSVRGERETCECVKTGEEDNRFTLGNLVNDEWAAMRHFQPNIRSLSKRGKLFLSPSF